MGRGGPSSGYNPSWYFFPLEQGTMVFFNNRRNNSHLKTSSFAASFDFRHPYWTVPQSFFTTNDFYSIVCGEISTPVILIV